MALLDVLLRYSTCTILLLIVLLIVRDARHSAPARYAALVCLSVAALLLGTPSYAGFELPGWLHVAVRLIDAPSIGLIWWLGRSLFEDDFKLGWFEWLGMALVLLPTFYFRLGDLNIIDVTLDPILYFASAITVSLMLHLVYVTLKGRHDDVIEERRRMRGYFVLGLVTATILIVVSERIFSPTEYATELSIFRVFLTFPMALWGLLWLTRFQGEKLEFKPLTATAPAGPAIDPRDQSLYAALNAEMREREAFRQSGLTIRDLAERLNTPEHRLRALINKGMGYRNFSSYVNEYRIAAVQEAMRKPENSRLPVLSMALDVGFNSLAPFNRAFRAITGETPTDFRDKLSGKSD